MLRRAVPFLCFIAFVCKTSAGDTAHRRTLARDFPAELCDNTRQGRWYLTDDRGVLCSRDSVDTQTGCCTRGQKHSCDTCSVDDNCCESFEHCVSCCLSPAHGAKAAVKEVFRGSQRSETGQWGTTFQYCRGKCRTSSNSTVNENAYLARNKHCFSPLGKPVIPELPLPALEDGVEAVMGQLGDSCTTTCSSTEKTSPAYVSSQADKGEQPTFCWVRMAAAEVDERAACDAAAPMLQRLCACAKPAVQDVALQPQGQTTAQQ